MSAEILGIVLGGVSIVVAVAITAWQYLHGEARKKSMPKKVDVTYFALKALVTAQKNATEAGAAIPYDELFAEIVEDCNSNTGGGNFDPSGKNKTLRAYTTDSIRRLSRPRSRKLEPLIEQHRSAHRVTAVGLDIFARLQPVEPSERPSKLGEYLEGSIDPHDSQPPRAVAVAQNPTTTARANTRRTTPAEWRYSVFMAMPEDETQTIDDLKQAIAQRLRVDNLRKQSTHDKVDQAIRWNLNNGNLSQEPDGRIRLATPKANKTLNDFM